MPIPPHKEPPSAQPPLVHSPVGLVVVAVAVVVVVVGDSEIDGALPDRALCSWHLRTSVQRGKAREGIRGGGSGAKGLYGSAQERGGKGILRSYSTENLYRFL